MVRLQVASPARLLYFSCSWKKTLQCSCSFRGVPTPSVQWLMGGEPVDLNSMNENFQVTSNIAAPWVNSTISLPGEPEIVTGLHCEGRNQYGIHTSSIFLIPPDKNSLSNVLAKGLIQGVVYGSIATALFFFFLVLLAMKMLKWWEKSHIPKASAALIPKRPELLEEPKTPQESAAEPSPASVAGGDGSNCDNDASQDGVPSTPSAVLHSAQQPCAPVTAPLCQRSELRTREVQKPPCHHTAIL